jgi:hypothetical protein
MTQAEFEAAVGRPLVTHRRFVADVRDACASATGYAAGKLGNSERAVLQYPIAVARVTDARKLRAFEMATAVKFLRHAGVFPADPGFYPRWAEVLADHVGNLDSIGLFPDAFGEELEFLRFHGLDPHRAILGGDQQPDRSVPSDEDNCYLPALAGRDVLLVCPFAGLLAARATKETFEAVWAKTGKPWFEPRSVQALEFPYGFTPATRERYASALDLLAEIAEQVESMSFDVALIAAGGLGIPLASLVKSLDRVGISLGGHLQILFGVLGARWRSNERWRRRYFNDAWIDMPARYAPDPRDTDANYW